MATDALLAALKSIADENGLTRIDIGYAGYGCTSDHAALVSIWFDAPEGIIGHAAEWGVDTDSAIAAALDAKARKLAAPIAEAA